MRRRDFIIVLGGAAAASPLPVRGQQSPSFLRVGAGGVSARTTATFAAFIERIAELGYEEGKTFSFEYVQAANVAGYEAMYHELASRNVVAWPLERYSPSRRGDRMRHRVAWHAWSTGEHGKAHSRIAQAAPERPHTRVLRLRDHSRWPLRLHSLCQRSSGPARANRRNPPRWALVRHGGWVEGRA